MKKLFTAIRRGDLAGVRQLLEKRPELIACTAKQPPKKDHGQSPLQVAVKSGNFAVAAYLLDLGADVNFMESESAYEWRMPVLHDAVMAAVMSARRNTNDAMMGFRVHSTAARADAAYNILRRMLEMGADVHACDSYGNTCLERAILDARQILPTYYWKEDRVSNDRIVTDELRYDLTRIFELLFTYGADAQTKDRHSGKPLTEEYEKEPVAQFLMSGQASSGQNP